MGQKLLEYYKYIGEFGGIKGKMALATETKYPSTIAATLPDSKENIDLFKSSVSKITGKPAPDL